MAVAAKIEAGSPEEPRPFGKYLLLGLIARGGMAEVYRAKGGIPAIADKLFAVKCMRALLAKEVRFVEMFIREGKLAVMLDHPAIVQTHEIGRIEEQYYIAMDYIPGKDLTQILRRGQETKMAHLRTSRVYSTKSRSFPSAVSQSKVPPCSGTRCATRARPPSRTDT